MDAVDPFHRLPEVLLPWYQSCARDLPWRHTRDPYPIWLSEIMLQQTRVEAVRGYYQRFLEALPDIRSLAEAPEQQLLQLWEGLGYYSRVRNLQKAARQIQELHGGVFPRDPAAVHALAGIGDYTCGAICSICFGLPLPAVDGNVLRVAARLSAYEAPADTTAYKKAVTTALRAVYPVEAGGDFNQALMELGATVCIPNGTPRCELCPCADFCLAKARDIAKTLPKRSPKRPRRKEVMTVLLLECKGRIALEKRPDAGLLAGLWQLPYLSGALSANQVLEFCLEQGLHPQDLLSTRVRTHIFTHVEWEMHCHHIRCAATPEPFLWAAPGEYPLPTAFRKLLPPEYSHTQ